jgi:hypothetical protein
MLNKIKMGTKGSFGFKIGKKIRLMHVQYDADLLWQICVREIYLLMKHYGSLDSLKSAFENLKEAKNKPKKEAIEKCKPFTDLEVSNKSTSDWYCLTRNCQHSFINILETGYFLNNGEDVGFVFIIDFNTNSVRFYGKNYEKKITEYEKATIEEIMNFDDMPTKSLTEIVIEMRERFEKYNENYEKIQEEKQRIQIIIDKAKELGGEQNIIQKANKLMDDMDWSERKIKMEYRAFYHRMDALNLIDHSKN